MASFGPPSKVAYKIGSEDWASVNPLIFQGLTWSKRLRRNPGASPHSSDSIPDQSKRSGCLHLWSYWLPLQEETSDSLGKRFHLPERRRVELNGSGHAARPRRPLTLLQTPGITTTC